jgi:hypothetical protein
MEKKISHQLNYYYKKRDMEKVKRDRVSTIKSDTESGLSQIIQKVKEGSLPIEDVSFILIEALNAPTNEDLDVAQSQILTMKREHMDAHKY